MQSRNHKDRNVAETLPGKRRFSTSLRLVCTAALIVSLSANITAGESRNPQDLSQFTLEDLMNLQVTSVSKKEQKLSRTGAAVYVITQEDIRRSGMTNIPDLLRMAPGINVARISGSAWAISIRGFNDRYATKVLVLIDGRSTYTQQFAGVYWDQLSVPLEDIDRIEVIRGPGGTVWGTNAVNGVINIITKHSSDTQGGLVSAVTGSEDTARGLVRYGGKAGRSGSYRVFGKYFNLDNSVRPDGRAAADDQHGSQAGFRSDWNLSTSDTLTVEGDAFQAREGQTISTVLRNDSFRALKLNDRVSFESGNLMGRWTHKFSNGSETALQVFYTDIHRVDQGESKENSVTSTFSTDFNLAPATTWSPESDIARAACIMRRPMTTRTTSHACRATYLTPFCRMRSD
jgi:iron complex outermembrane recepter protein